MKSGPKLALSVHAAVSGWEPYALASGCGQVQLDNAIGPKLALSVHAAVSGCEPYALASGCGQVQLDIAVRPEASACGSQVGSHTRLLRIRPLNNTAVAMERSLWNRRMKALNPFLRHFSFLQVKNSEIGQLMKTIQPKIGQRRFAQIQNLKLLQLSKTDHC